MDQQEFQTLVIDQFRLVHEEIREVKQDLRAVIQDLHDLRMEVRGYEGKLNEVYEARHFVKIKFGWQWGMVSFFIAFVAAGLATTLN